MRQLTYTEHGTLEDWDVAEPRLQQDSDAVVEPVVASTCDVDAWIISGKTSFPAPIALGHEAIGRVVDVGDEVRSLDTGQLVAIPWHICCGDCEPCRRGHSANCASVPPLSAFGFGAATGSWGGAFSERMRVPFAEKMLVPVPTGVDPQALVALGDNLTDAWRTIGPQLTETPGAEVLVVGGGGGGGSIGLYAAAMAQALGAVQVTYIDPDEGRRERANRLGIVALAEPGEAQPRYPVTVDASGDPGLLRHAISSTAPEGICTSVGIYFEAVELPLFRMYATGINFRTGRSHARAHMPEVLALIQRGAFDPEIATTRVIEWHDAAEALREPVGKLVFAKREALNASRDPR